MFLKENLFFLRKGRKKTLKYMAAMLGLSGKTSYYAYEQGRAEPKIETLIKLSDFFNISIDKLIKTDLKQQ